MVCTLKCDPLHAPTRGYRAQCSLMDGRWFEKAIGNCAFEHKCYWPGAGPMGNYYCHDNLMEKGYHEVGHSVLPYGNGYGSTSAYASVRN